MAATRNSINKYTLSYTHLYTSSGPDIFSHSSVSFDRLRAPNILMVGHVYISATNELTGEKIILPFLSTILSCSEFWLHLGT